MPEVEEAFPAMVGMDGPNGGLSPPDDGIRVAPEDGGALNGVRYCLPGSIIHLRNVPDRCPLSAPPRKRLSGVHLLLYGAPAVLLS